MTLSESLIGKVAVVAGVAGATGCAIEAQLRVAGATVVVIENIAIPMGRRDYTAKFIIVGDLTEHSFVKAAFAKVVAEHKVIDILVNNSHDEMRRRAADFVFSDLDALDEQFGASLRSTILCSRQVIEGMQIQQSGRIINVTSDAAFSGFGLESLGAASASVVGYTRSLARKVASFGVTVNAVATGYASSQAIDQTSAQGTIRSAPKPSIGLLIQPDDIAYAVSFFAGNDSGYVTGQTLMVNRGGWMN